LSDYRSKSVESARKAAMAARPGETEDLASLANLNEAILLDELKARYKKDDIYVSSSATRV